jgi:hypothetical protein
MNPIDMMNEQLKDEYFSALKIVKDTQEICENFNLLSAEMVRRKLLAEA